jgi:hypothetical protein
MIEDLHVVLMYMLDQILYHEMQESKQYPGVVKWLSINHWLIL